MKKLFCPKLVGLGGGFDLSSQKTWCWSLFGSILAVQNTFPNNLLVFAWRFTFLGKDWCTNYQALSLSLKCYAWSANLRILLTYTQFYFSPIFTHFWTTNQVLTPTLGLCLHIDFISITRNVDLTDILYQEGGVTQNDFEKLISLIEIINLFFRSGFWKHIVSNCLNKIH